MLKPSFLSNEYLVSDEGYILSKRFNKPLKPSINHNGYSIINIRINGKTKGVAVHTMVARAFCSGYKTGLTVNHKDGNKLNNSATNLEWITSYENTRHAIEVLGKNNIGKNNPNAKKVKMINKKTKDIEKTFDSLMDAAKYINCDADYKELRHIQNNICRVLKRIRKSYKNYIWEYA